MKREKHIALMAIFIFLLIIITYVYAEQQNQPVNISADYLEYIKEDNIIIGKGNVEIKHTDTVITGDEAIANLDKDEVQIKGNVIVTDKNGELKGESIVYNLKTKTGTLQEGTSFSSPWYVRGEQVDKVAEKKVLITRGYFTTCDEANPHYRFRAKKMSIYLKDKIVARNVFLYVGKVPIFYFPVLWQSLKGQKYDLDVRVGYNNVEGDFAKIRFGYPLTAHLYGRLYLDYMSKKGWGKGTELIYKSDTLKGSIYGYHIRELDTQKERWSGKASHWQNIGKNLTLVSDLNFLSDENFNVRYKEDDPTRITRELKSYVALTLTKPLYVARIVTERRDIWQNDKFIRDYIYLPRFNFDTSSIRINKSRIFPLYYKTNLQLDNYYAQSPNDFYKITLNVDQGLSSSIRLNRFTTVNPSVGFKEQWQNQATKTDLQSLRHHIYQTNINFRNTITNYFYVNYGHSFQEEIGKPPTTNILSGSLNFIFPRTIKTIGPQQEITFKKTNLARIDVSTTYDIRQGGITFNHWKQRFSSLLSKLYFTPFDWQSLNVENYYNLYTEKIERLQTMLKFSGKKFNIDLTGTYFEAQPSLLDTSFSVEFWLTNKWKLNLTNRASVYYKQDEFKYSSWSERTYTIYRDLHCWEAQFYWTKRPTEEQLWFKINIKALPRHKIVVYHNVEEEEWHLGHGR